MSDLTEFLLARIAEDESEARAFELEDHPEGEREFAHQVPDLEWVWTGWETSIGKDMWRLAVRSDRVLAECDAKRQVIEWHKAWPILVERAPTLEEGDGEGHYSRGDLASMTVRMSQRIAWMTDQEYRVRFGSEPPTGPVLQLLALPYCGHPDYREEWRP